MSPQAKPYFESRGRVELVDGGFEVLESVVFVDSRGQRFEAPKGFTGDGESVPPIIPGIVHWLLGSPWYTLRAGVMHDRLYWTGEVSRRDADRVYNEALLVLDALAGLRDTPGRVGRALEYVGLDRGVWGAHTKWLGVRVGAWFAWRKHRARDALDYSASG